MVEVDLRSLKRFGMRFVLDIDFTGLEPDEDFLREVARDTTARLAPGGNDTYAVFWVRTPKGWTGALAGWRELDDADEWLADFVRVWPGRSGRIIGGPRADERQQVDMRPALTSYLYLTTSDMRLVDPDENGWFWGVDETTTRYFCDQLLYWCHRPRAVQRLTFQVQSFRTVGLDHARSMAEAVMMRGSLALEAAFTGPVRARNGKFQPHGLVEAQVIDPTLDWRERLDEVRKLLTWSPPRSDYGYIRFARGESLGDDGESWPYVDESVARESRPVLSSFVPDAFGIQLLTDAHLARAHDLSGWDITPLDGGRHLVVARDLERWFRSYGGTDEDGHNFTAPVPDDPDLLVRARADFGDMILTPEVAAEHDLRPGRRKSR